MTDTNAHAQRARAQAFRQARLGRVRTLRRRIIAASVAVFVAAWLLITVVLVSGHDPALARNAKPAAVSSSSSSATGSGSNSSSSGATGSASNLGSGGGSVSSVTTQQS